MARETLKDFLNSIGSSANKISYVRKEGKDGLGQDPNTEHELLDLVNETKGLLGDYLKFIVDDENNVHKFLGGNEEAAPSNRGDALVLADEQGIESSFIEQGTNLASKLNEYSNSGKFDASGKPLQELIDKTGATSNFHNSLKDIEGRTLDTSGETLVNPNGDSSDIVQASQNMFLNNNRFANVGNQNNDAFTKKPQNIEEFESFANNRGTLNFQTNFGLYDKSEFKAAFERLKNVGASIILKASGFDSNDSPGNSALATSNIQALENNISEGNTNAMNASADGFAKRDVGLLRAKNAAGYPSNSFGESIRAGREEFVSHDPNATNSKSFGSTYNNVMTFSSKNRGVHKIQAALSIIALKQVASTFYNTFKEYLKTEDSKSLQNTTDDFLQTHDKTHVGLYILGQSRKLSSLALDTKLFSHILTATSHPYTNCVDRGLEIVFGIESGKNPEAKKIAEYKNFAQAPGFWFAVANSVLKSYDNIVSKIADLDTLSYSGSEIFIILKDIFDDNAFLGFFNAMAVIGDISLTSTNSTKSTNMNEISRYRDVDNLKNTPGNRVGKSRIAPKKGQDPSMTNPEIAGENTLAWEQSATPSMYLLPINMMRAASMLNNSVVGANPARGMLGSRMVRNTYFALDVDGSYNRIPQRLVKSLEDKLEGEYVPFYFHDLRTNEILSFNAFLTQLTDNISSDFQGVTGYGRLDPVQVYRGTTRNLQVGFTLYATNREDFDEMWYKINKFVTLLYPQWTQGTLLGKTGSKFYQPFSQVVGASPIVRLRVGDVIKSNYSRFALARTFGIGDKEVVAKPNEVTGLQSFEGYANIQNMIRDIVLWAYVLTHGSPIGVLSTLGDVLAGAAKGGFQKLGARLATDAAIGAVQQLLVNGFVNPLACWEVVERLRDPNVYTDTGYDKGLTFQVIIKPNMNTGYFSPEDGKKYFLTRRVSGHVVAKTKISGKHVYEVLIKDGNSSLTGKSLHVSHSDILPDPGPIYSTTIAGMSLTLGTGDLAGVADAITIAAGSKMSSGAGALAKPLYSMVQALISNKESQFMDPANNPFSRAFETTKGRGIAGVIKGVNFNWLENNIPWETDYNARAPIGVDISFQFDVIHDIPPGLDHSGYNRAPLYNVGEIMKNVAGDPHGDQSPFGSAGEGNYTASGATSVLGEKKGKK